MRGVNRIRANGLRGLGLVLVLPFVLLTLIAPGYMPVRDADGGLRMVICSDAGMVEITIDPATGEPVESAPEDGRCAWMAAAMADLVPAQALPKPPVTLGVGLVHGAVADLISPAFDPRGLYARGPPLTI